MDEEMILLAIGWCQIILTFLAYLPVEKKTHSNLEYRGVNLHVDPATLIE
jgi:hypothetical protein